MLRATITDIAKEVNTTAATVSRALSNHPRISEKTKRSVHAAAVKLNYKRDRVASSLRSGKTHLIGVIIPSAEINFFGSVVHGIESIANAHGYGVFRIRPPTTIFWPSWTRIVVCCSRVLIWG